MVQAASDTQLELAVRHHERGEYAQAEQRYQQVLTSQPGNVEAWHSAGILALQNGDYRQAITRLNKAVGLGVTLAGTHFLLGRAHKALGDVPAAVTSYQRALQIEPTMPEVWISLGIAQRQLGRIADAESSYRQAIKLKPDAFEAQLNLGNVLQQQGKLAEAMQSYQQALTMRDNSAELHYNMGKVLALQGQFMVAANSLQRAIMLDANFLDAHYNFANALSRAGQHHQALEQCKFLMSALEAGAGRPAAGVERDKLHHDTRMLRASCFLWSANYEAAQPELEALLDQEPDSIPLLEHLLVLVPYRYTSNEKVHDLYRHYSNTTPLNTIPVLQPTTRPPENRRLHIAYLSADLRDHSVAFFMEPILANHDHDQYEISCYSLNEKNDAVTERLRIHCDRWIESRQLDDPALARQIIADQVDILVDLSGRTLGNRLGVSALRAALLQVTYLGYPTYTGMKQIDWRITDATIDPQHGDADMLDSEKPARLPGSMFCYRPPDEAPDVNTKIGDDQGHIRFGSFNQVQKISPETLQAWIAILQRVPDSRLILKAYGLGNDAVRERILNVFITAGIAAERIELRSGEAERGSHLAMYHDIDIALDTYPYNGATTTCEALWMGVPVLTWCGETHASRVGASLLSTLGLSACITHDLHSYVDAAVSLATQRNQLQEWHATLRTRFAQSLLVDGATFTRHFETLLRQSWRCRYDALITTRQ